MNVKSVITTLSIAAIAVALVLLLLQQKKPQTQPVVTANSSTTNSASIELPVELNTVKQKASYGLGFQIANTVKQQNSDLDANAIALGVKDVLSGEPRLDREEMQTAMRSYQKEKMKKRTAQGEQNAAKGKAFLEENIKKEGVVATGSGLQYKVLVEGGEENPKITDTVVVNYKGTLINGEEFDSSYGRGVPATFALNRVIKGWGEGIQLMGVGGKYLLFIPPELGYGARGAGLKIPPNTTLIFEVELVEIKKAQAQNTPAGKAHAKAEKN